MNTMVKTFKCALQIYWRDKIIMLLGLIPIILGLMLYGTAGGWLYQKILGDGKKFLLSYLQEGWWSGVLFYLLTILITVSLFFIVSWTFILVIGLLSSPFNGIICERTERYLFGPQFVALEAASSHGLSWWRQWIKSLFYEGKKLLFILGITLGAYLLSIIPLLAPLGVLATLLLVATSFLDYPWSRQQLSWQNCWRDLWRRWWTYALAGGMYLLLIAIPVINLWALVIGVIHYTILFHMDKIKLNEQGGIERNEKDSD